MPKHSLKYLTQLWKSPENYTYNPQNGQNDPLKSEKCVKFWHKIAIFWVNYEPLELKIQSSYVFKDKTQCANTP